MADLSLPKPRHHTKDKGDLGVAYVIADLAKHGIDVALPLSEHWPFDLLAISPGGDIARLSVKFRAMTALGTVQVQALSIWSDRHGVHRRLHNATDYDGLAIYCPDTDRCYYVPATELRARHTTLRILESRNRQKLGVRMADQYTDPHRLFQAPVAQLDRAMAF